MPIYEYKCESCGRHLERRQSVRDEPLKICDECGGKLQKQWSRTGFQFKGEGWYVTDYASNKAEAKSENSEKSEKAEKSSKGESTASSDTASNTKATTTTTKADAGSKDE
ncbi:MAG: FmdB family zinc ribbon protein [Pyrinomonadaceae bacterium]